MEFKRDRYLNWLIKWKDKEIVKVIKGVRHCGKSNILLNFKKYLIDVCHVDEKNILMIEFEKIEFINLNDFIKLNEYILEKAKGLEKLYLLLDEIQNVNSWEKTINSLRLEKKIDIYLTGSNSKISSSDLSTLITGRTVSLNVYPLTFKEYLNFKGAVEKEKNETHFENFLENGGLPFTVSQLENDTQMIREYVSGVECDIIYKDIILKENISNPILFNRVKNFMYSSIGNYLSINNIRKQLLQSNLVIKNQLINKYISSLTDAFLFYKVERFDCVGKKILKIDPKYYVSDLSFRNINVPIPEENYGYLLENIVYFELLYRDYEVYVGQKNDLQIDFVVKKNFKKIYIQVCTQLNELNYSREIKNLKNISEPGCEMLFISKEKRDYYDELNVHHINIIDWLLKEEN